MKNVMIILGIILFLSVMLVIPTIANSEEKEKLAKQIDVRVKVYSDKKVFPSPPISLTLRMTAPHLVEKVETIYFSALDYQFLSLRSLRYAKEFLNAGDTSKANKYIEKADRYYRLATSLQRDSLAVLDTTYSAAEWMVVYKASRTALGFTATGLGIVPSTIFDAGTLYTDYLLDTSVMPVEEAKKNLIAKAISRALLRFTGASDLIGDAVKHGWGSSRVYPVLQKIMGSSEFKDAVLKEFMRLGGDIGDYAARKTIEEVLERIIKGSIEERPEQEEAESGLLPLSPWEEIPVKDGLATVLVMDKSGSMTGEKFKRAQQAAYVYVDTCTEQKDLFSLAAFSSNAESITEPISIDKGREMLKRDILSLSAGGSTNVGAGLTIAFGHLSSCNLKDKRAVLMSDGKHNSGTYKPEVAEFQKIGWPISTVAFGRDADQETLAWIAYQTGGSFFPAESSDIASVYHKINVLSHNGSVYRSYNDFIRTGEKLTYDIPVEPDMKKVGFFTNWQGSRMETIIFSPNKTVINRSNISSWGKFVEGETHNCFEIDNPQSGTWQALITGYNLPPKGEQVNFHSFCQSDIFSNILGFQPRYSRNQRVQIGVKLAEVINGRLSPLREAQITAEIKKPSTSLNKFASDMRRKRLQPTKLLEIFREISSFTRKITLFDDGLHGDVMPKDGIYANTYNDTTVNGPYIVTIDCQGYTSQSMPLKRTLQESFQVGPIEQNSFTISDFLDLIARKSIGRGIPQRKRIKERQPEKIVESLLDRLLKKKK